VRRFPWLRSRTLKGIGYVTPTALVVGVFFIVPLVLVFWNKEINMRKKRIEKNLKK